MTEQELANVIWDIKEVIRNYPQFRSIILCNLLLYIDVIFWD